MFNGIRLDKKRDEFNKGNIIMTERVEIQQRALAIQASLRRELAWIQQIPLLGNTPVGQKLTTHLNAAIAAAADIAAGKYN